MNNLFWQPQDGERVMLKPAVAASWPFDVERKAPFIASKCNAQLQLCWITPEDARRRWHSAPIQFQYLMPMEAQHDPLG